MELNWDESEALLNYLYRLQHESHSKFPISILTSARFRIYLDSTITDDE
jgi:hypothetical protein